MLPGRACPTDTRMWGRTPGRRGRAELPGSRDSARAPCPRRRTCDGVDAILQNAFRPRNRERKPFSASVSALKRGDLSNGARHSCPLLRFRPWQPPRRSLRGETGTGVLPSQAPPRDPCCGKTHEEMEGQSEMLFIHFRAKLPAQIPVTMCTSEQDASGPAAAYTSSAPSQIQAGFQGMTYGAGISFLSPLFITAGNVPAGVNAASVAAPSAEER